MNLVSIENEIEGKKGTILHLHSIEIPNISLEDYSFWLFQKPHTLQKNSILERACLPFPPVKKTIEFATFSNTNENIDALIQDPLIHRPSLFFSKTDYQYLSEGHFYLHFSGNDFRSYLKIEETLVFFEFPTMAHLSFVLETIPQPSLIPNIKRHYDFHQDEYLNTTKEPSIHILNMSFEPDLRTFFLAFEGANIFSGNKRAVIHTNLSQKKESLILQILAAMMADVDLVFEKLEDEKMLVEAVNYISQHKNAKTVPF